MFGANFEGPGRADLRFEDEPPPNRVKVLYVCMYFFIKFYNTVITRDSDLFLPILKNRHHF